MAACEAQNARDTGEPGLFGAPTAAFLDEELVQVLVTFEGEPTDVALRGVTDCAAAEAASLRDYPFIRHVRTATSEDAGIRTADAVYTASRDRPRGAFVIDVGMLGETCRETAEAGLNG